MLALTASAAPHPFYAQMLQRGVHNVQRGKYVEAVKELRIAAFGLMDEVAAYQTAQVHLAVAQEKLGKPADARLSAAKFVQSERIAPRYASLNIDAATRATFEKLVAAAIEPEYLASLPAFRRSYPQQVSAVASTASPVLPETKPAIPPAPAQQPKPVVEQPKPVVEQPKPVVEQPKAVVEQPKAVVEQPKAIPPQPKPAVEQPKPQPIVAPKPAAPVPLAGLREAQQLLHEGKLLAAREAFARLGQRRDLQRSDILEIGKGLNRTGAWQESAFVYQKAQPFRAGEEQHMFYEALNRYELGELSVARALLARSVASLPQTREVTMYRARIEGGL